MRNSPGYVIIVFALLVPVSASANVAIPTVFLSMPVMIGGLIPVIAIEAHFFVRRLEMSWLKALLESTCANVVTTVLGVPVLFVFAVVTLVGDNRGFVRAEGLPPLDGVTLAQVIGAALVFLVPAFLISWAVEYVIIWLINRRVSAGAAWSACFRANLASYAFLAAVTPPWYWFWLG